ncbi:MAG: DUF3131 domain-containing protein, partial [Shewanella sp.]
MLKTITLILALIAAIISAALITINARSDGIALIDEGALSHEQRQWATTAWRYVQNNTQPSSGLVNGKDRYPATTLWNLGDT